MSAFYNENDPYAARWLANLMDAGHIAPGAVSAKSIVDLEGRELAGVRQAHFFAGIGVWSAALRAAGWPDSRRVWTGSCPCQPFSGAGKGKRFADERHLWPFWFWLIEQHRPDVIFGEQVEGPAGRAWLDLVFTDLEAIGYACGAVVFPAAGVGAPHGRHRTYWLAHAQTGGWREFGSALGAGQVRHPDGGRPQFGRLADAQRGRRQQQPGERSASILDRPNGASLFEPRRQRASLGRVADASDARWQGRLSGRPDQEWRNLDRHLGRGGATGGLADANGDGRYQGRGGIAEAGHDGAIRDGPAGGLGDAAGGPRKWEARNVPGTQAEVGGKDGSQHGHRALGPEHAGSSMGSGWAGPIDGVWRSADWIFCRDGKWRPIEPGTFPLAHGAPARVGRLRAYGNAIVLRQAQAFIESFLDLEALSL